MCGYIRWRLLLNEDVSICTRILHQYTQVNVSLLTCLLLFLHIPFVYSIRISLLVYINNKVYIDTGSKDGLSRKKYFKSMNLD